MKHKLILSALFCGAALFAETPVEFKVQPQMEWKKLDNGEYAVERTADLKHNAHLMLIMPELKPETFYAIEWEAKGENVENNGMVQYMLAMEQTVYPKFMVGKDWNLNRRYFHTGKNSSGRLSIYVRPPFAQKLQIRNIKLAELAKADYENGFTQDFENENTLPGFWIRSWKQKEFAADIVKSDFINGDKSMKLTLKGMDSASIQSAVFPMVPGAKYKISFWAKGSGNGTMLFIFNAFNDGVTQTPPQNIIRRDCAIETEWKEYAFEIVYPTDLKKFASAAVPMANLAFSTRIPEILIDDVKVELIK